MSRRCRVLEKGHCEITQEYSNNHNAVDIVGANYTLDYVVSHSDGKVVFFQDGYGNMKGSTGNDSYGNCVKIDHSNGYYTLYAHMLKGLLVKNGSYVKKGQRIGYMSDSGNAYGGHLHFEVRHNDQRIDPTAYLDVELPLSQPTPTKSIDEIAKDVIAGKYGNYPERKVRLEAEGYNYNEVQGRVDAMLAGSTPAPAPAPAPIGVGESVIVNGVGTSSSDGSGSITRMFNNHRMKVIAIRNNTSHPYACNQYNEGIPGDYSKVTAWFSADAVRRG